MSRLYRVLFDDNWLALCLSYLSCHPATHQAGETKDSKGEKKDSSQVSKAGLRWKSLGPGYQDYQVSRMSRISRMWICMILCDMYVFSCFSWDKQPLSRFGRLIQFILWNVYGSSLQLIMCRHPMQMQSPRRFVYGSLWIIWDHPRTHIIIHCQQCVGLTR